ncbi:MAG: hypothetical protein LC774_10045 [Acidobacteria bacterium]|nr:hypothetical protein [Acidobacteriota bacterium]
MPLLKDIAEIIGIAVAIVTLVLSLISIMRARKIERAKFWLDLRDRLTKFHDIHVALCPDGEWDGDKGSPATNREWRQLDAYMGLIEHCSLMIDDWLLDWETFVAIYSYRIGNVARNPYISQEKLINRADRWKTFLELIKRLDIKFHGTDKWFEDYPKRPLSPPIQTLQVILTKDPAGEAGTQDEQSG